VVQIAGALALYRGYLAEMATGEGKSLTACLPATLSAWTGRACHIVTVNDYLAGRDANEMKKFYSFCGVSTGVVTSTMEAEERKKNYAGGVVYTTSKELVADFLRDRLVMGSLNNSSRRIIRSLLFSKYGDFDGIVMRGIDTAIIDEADSVLIDEAVTPLIISRPVKNKPFTDICLIADEIADNLIAGKDYITEDKYKEIIITKPGYDKIGQYSMRLKGIWQNRERSEELINQALTAREYYIRDKQYVVQDDKVIIVDEFTGRLMPNRTWRQGLHQAVEAREKITLTDPSETLSRLSFQQFFRFFRKLSGMSGTASEAAGEFWQIYGLPVIKIPTNRPCIRKEYKDRLFATRREKWLAIVEQIEKEHCSGRPVLIGTKNVKASEKLSQILDQKGLNHNLLNAVNHKEEAGIIRIAGQEGRITISTNMAGRGTDIKLDASVAQIGGLHVIATERHESKRIDRQLFGRSARQGDAGSCQAFISMEDELIERYVPKLVRIKIAVAIKKNKPMAKTIGKKAYSGAQRTARRLAFHQRKSVLKMDNWLTEALSFTGREI
jgi:preprotein translocase subunit SecA